jgi:hypothetical protein
MRKSASEIISDLEMRIARLEKSASKIMATPYHWDEDSNSEEKSGRRDWIDVGRLQFFAKEYGFDLLNLSDGVVNILTDEDGFTYLKVDAEDLLNDLLS